MRWVVSFVVTAALYGGLTESFGIWDDNGTFDLAQALKVGIPFGIVMTAFHYGILRQRRSGDTSS